MSFLKSRLTHYIFYFISVALGLTEISWILLVPYMIGVAFIRSIGFQAKKGITPSPGKNFLALLIALTLCGELGFVGDPLRTLFFLHLSFVFGSSARLLRKYATLHDKYSIELLRLTVITLLVIFLGFSEALEIPILFEVKENGWVVKALLIAGILYEGWRTTQLTRDEENIKLRNAYNPTQNHWFAATFGLVSHNLKTPLANIQGQVEIIRLLVRNANLIEHPLYNPVNEKLSRIEHSVETAQIQLEKTIDSYKNQITLLANYNLSIPLLLHQLEKTYPGELVLPRTPNPLPLSSAEFFVLTLVLQVAVDNALHYGAKPVYIESDDYQICVIDSGHGFPAEMIQNNGNQIVKSSKSTGIGLFYSRSLLQTIHWGMELSNNEIGAKICISKSKITQYQMTLIR